ncbi:MAG: hypothetical protein PVF05_12440 [Gemmatimonadales bacterium]|jgi:hypothetical protein
MPNSRLLTLLLIAASTIDMTACHDEPAVGTVAVADSAGVRLLTALGPGWSPESGWRLELDLEIGAADGAESFGRIVDVVPRRIGGVWIADAHDRRVRGFDEAGREVAAFGGAGDGPGELRSIGRIGELPDGRLRIGGRMPVELYQFDTAGRPLGRISVAPDADREVLAAEVAGSGEAPPAGPSMGSWRFGTDGAPFLQTTTLEASADGVRRHDVLGRVSAEGVSTKLVEWEAPAMRGGIGGELLLLRPAASWTPAADGGAWWTRGDGYEVRRVDPAGRLRSVLRRPGARIALTADVKQRFRSSLADEADNPALLAMLENAVFPDSLPATAGLWASDDDRLWVGVTDAAWPLRLEEPNALDVFETSGRYLGRLAIPAGLRPTRVTADHLYGVWEDELGVTYARRYRIVREG